MPAGAESRDDISLMLAITQGDRDALACLYDRHSPMLMAICRRVLNDAGDAEDVLTDVFFELWSKADRYDSTRGNALSYIITLTRSRAIDRKRSRTARPAATSDNPETFARPSTAPGPLQTIDLNEQREIVRAAMNTLDAAQREAVECAFFDGLSHSEVADKLNKPLGTIKTNIRQGLIRLREALRIKE